MCLIHWVPIVKTNYHYLSNLLNKSVFKIEEKISKDDSKNAGNVIKRKKEGRRT